MTANRIPNQFDESGRVALGAGFMDEHFPGWTKKIRVTHLRIESCFDCLLGQLFGAYDEAKTRVIGPLLPRDTDLDEWAYRYGFLGGTDDLRVAWVEQIALRTGGTS